MANKKTRNYKKRNNKTKKTGGLEVHHDDKSKTDVSFIFFSVSIKRKSKNVD